MEGPANRFSDNAGPDIKLFGDLNLIVAQGETTVRDRGDGNRVENVTGAAQSGGVGPREVTLADPVASARGRPRSWQFLGPVPARALGMPQKR